MKQPKTPPEPDPHNGLCAHQYPDGRRCPLPGRIGGDTGGGGRDGAYRPSWRCWVHTQGGVKLGRDWRHEIDLLTDAGEDLTRAHDTERMVSLGRISLRRQVDAMVAERPEWRRRDGEGRADYRKRMIGGGG